jgi:hypothetical protein
MEAKGNCAVDSHEHVCASECTEAARRKANLAAAATGICISASQSKYLQIQRKAAL